AAWQFAALGGFLDGLERRRTSLNQLAERDAETKRAAAALARVFAAARAVAEDAKQPTDVRAQSVRLLGRGPDGQAAGRDLLQCLLGPKTPPEVQAAAITALGGSATRACPTVCFRAGPATVRGRGHRCSNCSAAAAIGLPPP